MRIGIGELLLILGIVLLLFGSKRLRGIGTDLGASIKGFRESMKENRQGKGGEAARKPAEQTAQGRIIEGETVPEDSITEPLRKQRPKG